MKNTAKISLLMACCWLLTGCALFNPYQGDFECPRSEKGKCQSIKASYDESLDSLKDPANSRGRDAAGAGDAEDTYKQEVFKKLSGLLKQPETPMVAPPKVIRVLMLPYKGDARELYMQRYVYIILQDADFVIGDYLVDRGDE